MVDRTRIRPVHHDPMASLMDDHYPTKKSRDSNHQWSDASTGSVTEIKSLMDIDVTQNPRNFRRQQPIEYLGGGNNSERSDQTSITPLLDMDLIQPPPQTISNIGVIPFPANMAPAPVYQSYPVSLMNVRPDTRPLPVPVNPQRITSQMSLPDGSIPSLLDLPISGSSTDGDLGAGQIAEFESLVEKLVSSVKTKLPLCSITPVKTLESTLQKCKLPRGFKKYKQLDKSLPILCKLYVNDLLLGVGIGDNLRDADIAAYSRALKLLRETAFEDIMIGRPLREEITDLMANLSQKASPNPSSHRRFVVLEDRKAGESSNSYFTLALSAEFSGREISITATQEDDQYTAIVMLDDKEVGRSSGKDEAAARRAASTQALEKLKATCPVIEIIGNNENWRYEIKKNLKAKIRDSGENLDNYISKQRKYDEAITVCTKELGLKFPVAVTPAKDLEKDLTHIIDVYVQSGSASPLIVAPLPARSQRLLLFRLARQRGLCTESVRIGNNSNHELSLVPVVRRRLEASVLLPVVEKADGNCTERFRLVTGADESDEV